MRTPLPSPSPSPWSQWYPSILRRFYCVLCFFRNGKLLMFQYLFPSTCSMHVHVHIYPIKVHVHIYNVHVYILLSVYTQNDKKECLYSPPFKTLLYSLLYRIPQIQTQRGKIYHIAYNKCTCVYSVQNYLH